MKETKKRKQKARIRVCRLKYVHIHRPAYTGQLHAYTYFNLRAHAYKGLLKNPSPENQAKT